MRASLVFVAVWMALTPPPGELQARVPSATQVRVGSDSFERFDLPMRNAPSVRYYISRTRTRKPLVLYIQGSGCTPAFVEMQPGNVASTIFSLTTVAHRGEYAVMALDKPHAASNFPKGSGTATGCSAQFNQYFSYGTWLEHIERAFRHARRLPWVDGRRSLVIGISEGATMAAGLAARNPSVTNVALLGGSGPGQYFDFVTSAYAEGRGDEKILSSLEALDGELAAILADPESSTKFAWGHPYRRWSSFFRVSSTEELKRSRARVYLVSGMADESVPILSSEVNYAALRASGRDVIFRRIPGAGHDLLPVNSDFAAHMDDLEAEFARIMAWFDGRGDRGQRPAGDGTGAAARSPR